MSKENIETARISMAPEDASEMLGTLKFLCITSVPPEKGIIVSELLSGRTGTVRVDFGVLLVADNLTCEFSFRNRRGKVVIVHGESAQDVRETALDMVRGGVVAGVPSLGEKLDEKGWQEGTI